MRPDLPGIPYRLGLEIHRALYRFGILKRKRLPVPVISVGNLTVGGTGKTPCTIHLAREALRRGLRPAIVTRGYRGGARGTVVVSDGREVLLSPDEAGDEAVLMARALKDVPVIKSPDRHAGGLEAIRRFGVDLILLDDGFQHLALSRDRDVVLVDAGRPLAEESLLPFGRLREPLSALGRAREIVLTKADPGQALRVREEISCVAPGVPVSGLAYEPVGLVDEEDRVRGLDDLGNRRVLGFCGIARPEYFRHLLESQGAAVIEFLHFRDHHRYSSDDLDRIQRLSESCRAERIVTTEKDRVKIGGRAGWLALRIEAHMEPEALDRIFSGIS